MKKLFTLVFALMAMLSVNADELYLVGDGTPIGWEGDGNMRQTMRMTVTETNVYVWTGLLKNGGEGFKICNSFGGWDGYHPSSENFAIGESGTDNYTTSGNDWKWNPTNTDWQWYTITLDRNAGTLSWATTTPTLLEAVDGVYYIGTAEELNTLALMYRNNVDNKSYNVKLTADIDYTAYKNGSMSAIGVTEKFPFRGEFDGQNHTITVDLESYSTRFSFFGTIVGKVHNLKLAGKITATNKNQIGGICGLLKGNDNQIYNCISAVEIVDNQGGDGTIGGIAAVTYDASTIKNCAFYGKINAPSRDGNGGIVGWANSGASTTIENCLIVADINWNGGGEFGRNNPSVINSYKTTASDETLGNGEMTYKLNSYVSGSENWFQTLGTDAMPSPLSSSEKIYANGQFYCDGVTPKEGTESVLSNENASIVDNHEFGEDGICTVCHAAGQEAEEVDGVFQLNKAGNLLWWAQYVNAGNPASDAVLNADVDLSAAKYTPAGTSANKYVGTFDGQGHSVKLNIESSLNYQGLFGIATDGATIQNVIVKGSVKGNSYVGGIVGGSNGGEDGKKLNIINCGNEATISAAEANGAGIIGVNMSGSAHFNILNCYNVGKVYSGRESGAITGWTGGDKTTIENTYNIGTVVNGDGDGFIRGGGNLINTYNLSANDAQVASGELCFKLGEAFGQTLGTDAYPNFTGLKVYSWGIAYSNVPFGDLNVETANGDAECILPSMKWGGSYQAYTYVAQADFDFGDWNTGNPNYNVIIGVPAENNGKAWFAPGYSVEGWNYGQDLPQFGDGRPADVYAVRYFTVDGEIPSDLFMPAAHDDAPCEYYINGELIWAETDGWYEDEVVRLTDAQKALIKTDGTVNVFAFHVHQNWGGRYADGGLYTAGDMVNRYFNNDEKKALDATIVLAEEEGINAEVINLGKNANSHAAAVTALAQLRKARRLAFDARTENFTGSAPADGMIAYILNVGAKMFLAGGNDWGTHASLNHMGAKCVLHANSSGENRYTIQTNLPNGVRGKDDALGHNGYVDATNWNTTGANWAWEIKAAEDGTYHIINAENNLYLGMTDDERLQVDTDKTGADNEFNKWIFVTPEEFIALAENATPEAPVDLGHLVHQATFAENDFEGDNKAATNGNMNDSKWQHNAGGIWEWNSGNKDNRADHSFEMWNTNGYVYLEQVVEGLPAGKYTVKMNGFYRDGRFESADEGNVRQLAYMFAGSEKNCVPMASIVDGSGNCPGYGRGGASGIVIPDGCNDAARFFQVGTYVNTIDAMVGPDGKLKIGLFRGAEDVLGEDWIVTDNWRLYYKGMDVEATITDAGYATFVAPWNINVIPEGVVANAARTNLLKEGFVHLQPITAIPAGEAVVLKGAEGTYTFKGTKEAVELGSKNDLIAATEEVTADGTQFVLAKDPEDASLSVGFLKATTGTTIAAGKGYLVITESNGVKPFYPFEKDGATGIANIENTLENGVIYNVAGQRLGKTQKGINIINGKKVLK